MVLEFDLYRLKIRFDRLFADPRIFDSPPTFAREFLQSMGLPRDRVDEVWETSDPTPLDDTGRPSATAGIGRFLYGGKKLRSEYMQGANLRVEYADFGSGLRVEDHKRFWRTGRLEDLSFETLDFQHQHVETGIADLVQLYEILKVRAAPTTMATVELPGTSGDVFSLAVRYVEDRLRRLASKEGGIVEVYSAKSLEPAENSALEKRLGRESTDSTVYVILSMGEVGPGQIG